MRRRVVSQTGLRKRVACASNGGGRRWRTVGSEAGSSAQSWTAVSKPRLISYWLLFDENRLFAILRVPREMRYTWPRVHKRVRSLERRERKGRVRRGEGGCSAGSRGAPCPSR